MKPRNQYILSINGGSSSIRFAFYRIEEINSALMNGMIEKIGIDGTQLIFQSNASPEKIVVKIKNNDYKSVVNFLMDFLEEVEYFKNILAIGHRIVQGLNNTLPKLITSELIEELNILAPYDQEHTIGELFLINAFKKRHSNIPQIACFDTAFHHTIPDVARLFPIPRRFYHAGIKKYGFHGLSYSYLLEEFRKTYGSKAAKGKLIFAHLGNGASLVAILKGKSIDTSMGFTPAGGIPMSSRSGDLDPGIVMYLMKREKLTLEEFNKMIHKESGILGVSEISSDMRDLLKIENSDPRALDAINMFCYHIKKCIGSFTASLGGLDTLIFSAGIGENSPEIRSRICDGLEFLGIELNEKYNQLNKAVISSRNSRVKVYIIPTNEECIIARMTAKSLKK